jgi:predicted SAM-dependent methyltransferase
VKFNLGCGDDYKQGYVNVDCFNIKNVDETWDIKKIPYPDNSADEILASHVIEHFDANTGISVLKEWYRALKPNGILKIETPDLLGTCQDFVAASENRRIFLYNNFFSMADITPGQAHLFLYTETQLKGCLQNIGFQRIHRVKPWSKYFVNSSDEHLFLAVEAYK